MTRPLTLLAASLAALVACSEDQSASDAGPGAVDAAASVDADEPGDAGETRADARSHADAAEPLPDAAVEPDVWRPFAVLTLNLHCLKTEGTPYTTNAERFAAIARVAADEDVAVILAQEVCVRAGESAETEIRSALETATSTTWSSTWSFAHDAWAGTPDAAREGLAVFARGAGSIVSSSTMPHHAQGSLRRIMVTAKLSDALAGLTVYSVHLDHASAAIRARQAREVAAWTIAAADPSLELLVAGDFNAAVGSEPPERVRAMGFVDVAAPLEPSRIDHILLHRGARARAVSRRFAFDGAREPPVSDHPGVLVHLEPAAAPVVRATRLVATESAWSGQLFVRGDAVPLDWSAGWPAWRSTQTEWRLVLTELVADHFAYKWLRDDTIWQMGDDQEGVRGALHTTTPVFP